MAEMEMPIPDNTIPMMTGAGPYGSVEMGGMFTMLKVRKDQKPDDYKDPGWYKHPQGTVAYEWTGQLAEPARPLTREQAGAGGAMPTISEAAGSKAEMEVQVRKPKGHAGH
jgi:hypothetical protein